MKFKGYGSIYNPTKRKIVVDFQKTPEYETTDAEEIRLIRASGYATEESDGIEAVEEERTLTKGDIMAILDEREIDYNPRHKKEALAKLLEA